MTIPFLLLILLVLPSSISAQQSQTPGIIETKRIAIGDTNAMIFNAAVQQFALTFDRTFASIPRMGLAVYTMDFQYSPSFSCSVTDATTANSAVLQVRSQNRGQNNQLYLIYMATDHLYLGIFMPPALITDQLNLRLDRNQQSFRFNYKEILSLTSRVADIRLSVFLTGISTTSELTNNGYSVNRTYFRMFAEKNEMPFYNITVQVESLFGDITISRVEYTIVYFDAQLMASTTSGYARYQMDSGVTTFNMFGGTVSPSLQTSILPELPLIQEYQNIQIFLGISALDCTRGPSITILVYPTTYNNTNNERFAFNAQTWKLTFISFTTFQYIQYRSLRCDLQGSNCDANCENSPRPHYILNSICNYCHYSCLTCTNNSACATCDSTRQLNSRTGLCDCISGYYDEHLNYTCQSCFPCLTCSVSNLVCTTCNESLQLTKNQVLSVCECTIGYFPNYINTTTNNLNPQQPCLPCPTHCLLCTNSTFCLACDLQTYLSQGQCYLVCNIDQAYDQRRCISAANANLFDQSGRLGYDWTYTTNRSLINFTLTFSQPNTMFYYYENDTGYSYSNSAYRTGSSTLDPFFFDDGNAHISGYSQQTTQINTPNAPIAAFATSTTTTTTTGASSTIQPFNFNQLNTTQINGSYLGITQPYYYYLAYYLYQQNTGIRSRYHDTYGIPYGKVNLTTVPPVPHPNYLDALHQNLVLTIGTQLIAYQLVPSAAAPNVFFLTATLPRSYYGQTATLALKNPGLVRSNQTASQVIAVSDPIYIYVCTVPSYVQTAQALHDSNTIIVGVLWGISKYPLFVGFGWLMMPLMLVLQYIMSLNYIDTQRPLNLDMFLASFADFRNPSILYNPKRDQFDASIFTHPQMYVTIPIFNRFDRGIDFMRNCFQFFFVPFLSVVLYALIVGFNKLLNKFARRDIPLISQYIQPRLPLHIAAYALVQATAITFFFFAQLNDTKYNSPFQPNASYPVFNIAMSYLAFFLTCAIPILLMVYIYHKHTTKEHQFRTGSQLILVFNELLQSMPNADRRARLHDPLWTQDPDRTIAYGFGVSVFYLAILYGFFTSFFYDQYPWQLAGLIIITALFGFFAFINSAFSSIIIKAFWIIFSLLMLAFLLLLAAIGSNVAGAPCGQQDLGYLGIGFLYALILLALIACGYLIWLTVLDLYSNYCKNRPFVVNLDQKVEGVQKQAQRLKSMRDHTTRLKSSKIGGIGGTGGLYGSRAGIGQEQSMYGNRLQMGPTTDNRLRQVIHEYQHDGDSHITRQRLHFDRRVPQTGQYIFISEIGQLPYRFNQQRGKYLYNMPRIYIDPNGQIYDPQGNFLQTYRQISVVQPQRDNNGDHFQQFRKTQNNSQQDNQLLVLNQRQQQQSVKVINRYIYNGQQYQSLGQDQRGMMKMRNIKTGRVIVLDPNQLQSHKMGQQVEEVVQSDENMVFVNKNNNQPTQIEQHQSRRVIVQGNDMNNMNGGNMNNSYNTVGYNSNNMSNVGNIGYHNMSYNRNNMNNSDNMSYSNTMAYNNMNNANNSANQSYQSNRVQQMNNNRQNNNAVNFTYGQQQQLGQLSGQLGNIIGQTISQDIQTNQVLFNKNRKIKIDNQQYMNLGEQQGQIRLYNSRTKQIQKISLEQLIKMYQQSFAYRVQLQGRDYDISEENNQYAILIDTLNHNSRQVTAQELRTIRMQNQEALRQMYRKYPAERDRTVKMTSQEEVHTYEVPSSRQQSQQSPLPSYPSNNNLLLLQSKATKPIVQSHTIQMNKRASDRSVGSRQEIPARQIQMQIYQNNTLNQPQMRQTQSHQITQYKTDNLREQVELEEEIDPDTIEYILKKSPGPFQMYVMDEDKVQEIDDEDHYEKTQAREKQIILGPDVMEYMKKKEKLYPGCVIFMVDMSTQEEYRIN